uniref:condensation domain-containing protein n=1 Tax=Paraburkholderia sp. J63 TaxID=2805434 RepID=UPI002ABE607D
MSEIARDLDSELLSVSRAYVGLPPEKRKVFRSRLAERGVARASLPIVPFPGQSGRFPLSHAQERLWFLWRLEPLSASYNITGAVQLDGTLDTDAVRAAVQAVCARHESLRKRFEEHDGVAWQIVGETRYDWQQCELDPDAEASIKPLLRDLSLRPFDLTRDALLRVTLVRLAPDSHVLHFAMHHIVSDAWSLELLTQEFAQA